MFSNSRKVNCLKNKTGWSHKVSHEFLKENNWNLEQAMKAHDLMVEASLVPSKNSNVLKEINQSQLSNGFSTRKKNETPDLSETVFMLPDISKAVKSSDSLKQLLLNEFINNNTLDLLVKTEQLNWWKRISLESLYPLVTTGDGNCLLHAASIALNGVSDERLLLRSQLYHLITSPLHKQAFYRRWRLQQSINNKETGLVFTEAEWLEEWDGVVTMASPDPINNEGSQGTSQENISYSSLEEIHVFVLSHLLARPIIVIADTFYRNSKGEALAPIPFSGIYLPLQLPPSSCHKTPIHIAYNAAHFMAVCPVDGTTSSLSQAPFHVAHAPLVDSNYNLLPVHFSRDPGERFEEHCRPLNTRANLEEQFSLIDRYFDVEMLNVGQENPSQVINNHLTPSEETCHKPKGLEKLKRFAECTSATFRRTFHKAVSKGSSKPDVPKVIHPLNNSTTLSIQSLLSKCKIPVCKCIYLRQEFYAENIEEYVAKMRVGDADNSSNNNSLNYNNSSPLNNDSPSLNNSSPYNNILNNTNHQITDQKPNRLNNKITNNFKTHKIHDKNLCKLNKLKDVNYFNKSFDEAKTRIRTDKQLEEKARKLLYGGLMRSCKSDTFKSCHTLCSLEKFTKIDNRLIRATEVSACDFNDKLLEKDAKKTELT